MEHNARKSYEVTLSPLLQEELAPKLETVLISKKKSYFFFKALSLTFKKKSQV